MKKILAIALMMAVLVCPVLASGEPAAAPAAAGQTAEVPHYSLQILQEATCTENGLSQWVDSDTGEVLFTYDYPLATGHAPSAAAPTCDGDVVCRVCGEVLEPATGHEYEYQYDAERNDDGTFASFGTWKCVKCGDTQPANEGNAVYYYGLIEEPAAPAEEPAAPAASGEPAPSGEPSAEPAPSGEASPEEPAAEEPAGPANPNYNPAGYNWASIEIILAIAIVVVFVILMLSFGKKKKG